MPTITIRDESSPGKLLNQFTLDLLTEKVTVRELIRSRVYQEVQDYNAKTGGFYSGLVSPTEAERALNGFKIKAGRKLDWKAQFKAATEAFETNGVLVLVDDRQAETLEEQVVVGPKTRVTFLKLTPLVGG